MNVQLFCTKGGGDLSLTKVERGGMVVFFLFFSFLFSGVSFAWSSCSLTR